jgi:cystathionine beta-lyase
MNNGTLFGEEGHGFMRMNIGSPRSVLNTALINIEKAFNESDLIK